MQKLLTFCSKFNLTPHLPMGLWYSRTYTHDFHQRHLNYFQIQLSSEMFPFVSSPNWATFDSIKNCWIAPKFKQSRLFLEKLHLSHMILSQINLNLRKVWFSLVSRWCSSFVLYQTLLDSKLCPTFQGFHPYLRNCSQCHIQFKYKIIWCSVLSHVHKYNEWT